MTGSAAPLALGSGTCSGEVGGMRSRLRDFYDDYADALDQGDLDAWAEHFQEDCHYRVIPRENHDAGLPLGLIYCMNKNMIRDRITALRETTMYEPRALRHFISGVRILDINGSVIEARANFAIFECLSDREPTINMVGQYMDLLHDTPDGFRIKRRDCVMDNYRVRTSLIMPV